MMRILFRGTLSLAISGVVAASGSLVPAYAGSCDDGFNAGDLTIPVTGTVVAPHSPAGADESGPVSGPLRNGVTIQATGDVVSPQNPAIDGRTEYRVHKANCDVVVAQVESKTAAVNGPVVGVETIVFGAVNGAQTNTTVVKITSWLLCIATTRTLCPAPTIP